MTPADKEFGCPYQIAWVGRCNQIKGESGYCSTHAGKTCIVCGEQATNECNHAGQFVCGCPLCDNCEGTTEPDKGAGVWGFANHIHRRKPVEKRKHEAPRKMQAADIEVLQ